MDILHALQQQRARLEATVRQHREVMVSLDRIIQQEKEARMAMQNSTFDVDSLGIGKFRVATDGNRKFTPAETGIPGIGFTIGDLNGRTDDTYSYQIADNLSVVHGKHTLKTGLLIVHAAMDRRAANLTRGALAFSANDSSRSL